MVWLPQQEQLDPTEERVKKVTFFFGYFVVLDKTLILQIFIPQAHFSGISST
jgi:hypothetical protein